MSVPGSLYGSSSHPAHAIEAAAALTFIYDKNSPLDALSMAIYMHAV